ncbi:hypothetical protein ACFYTQ_11020 [Nocardia sp. NPDC004068]|uniref:hypothetical protein n=1 Tax=Nocardia sp. NPDC004068 TaxID=3364303 RepID=UPI003673B272
MSPKSAESVVRQAFQLNGGEEVNVMRRSEASGLEAFWRVEHQRVAVVAVRNIVSGESLLAFTPGTEPDLVSVREKWPEYENLWNAVRHDLWNFFGDPHAPNPLRDNRTTDS